MWFQGKNHDTVRGVIMTLFNEGGNAILLIDQSHLQYVYSEVSHSYLNVHKTPLTPKVIIIDLYPGKDA